MFYKKEKEVNDLILKHLEKVDDCLSKALRTVEEYLGGNIKEAKILAIKVDQIETETDEIRREIICKLYSGAYLPMLRENILRLVENLDEIADGAEACCDFFLDQRPDIPEDMRPEFLKIMKDSVSSFTPLREAIGPVFTDKVNIKDVQAKTRQVGIIESAVDKQEWDITRDIFRTGLDCGRKVHLKLCLKSIAMISDTVEDAADELEVAIIRSNV